ncbi:MAG: DUF1285 domain-containing protein [Geminicoccaceae bacterium]
MVMVASWDQAPRAAADDGNGRTGRPPPVERRYDIRIDRAGVWHHEGRPIARIALVKLFASILRRQADGSYWLATPVERGRIEVEDVPFVVVELSVDGIDHEQTIRVRSNLDEWVTIGPDHPLRLRRPPDGRSNSGLVPYVEIRPGLEGRLLRPVYYDLVDLGEDDQLEGIPRYGVWSAGRFFALDEQQE